MECIQSQDTPSDQRVTYTNIDNIYRQETPSVNGHTLKQWPWVVKCSVLFCHTDTESKKVFLNINFMFSETFSMRRDGHGGQGGDKVI